MGEIVNSYILPHPPILLPEIGKGEEMKAAATLAGCRKVAEQIVSDAPSVILLSSPHAPCFRDFIVLADASPQRGHFSRFGHPEISMEWENDRELASKIADAAKEDGIGAGFLSASEKRRYDISDDVDHGAAVPLYFVLKESARLLRPFKVIVMSTPFLPLRELYRFGQSARKAVLASEERAVYLASGDLSHRLTREASAGYDPYGKVYDEMLTDMLRRGDVRRLLAIKEMQMQDAGECGTRSFAMMCGFLDGNLGKPAIYSYEGPFGVGYMTAKFEISPPDSKPSGDSA